MTIRKALLCLGVIALIIRPCFAAEQTYNCNAGDFPNISSAPDSPVRSYKAAGKIEFLAPCPDSKELCKTGSYIVTGDYFIAYREGNYYCAFYIPGGYEHPKAVGLIKNENFTETPLDDYKPLQGIWRSIKQHTQQTIGFYKFPQAKFINIIGEAHYIHRFLDYPIPLINLADIVLKTGPNSFITGSFTIKVKPGELTLTQPEFYRDKDRYPDLNFRATYTYLGPSTLVGNIFK